MEKLAFSLQRSVIRLIICIFIIFIVWFSIPYTLNPVKAAGPKRVEINLTNQHLYAYEGSTLIYEFLISSGRWAPTPTGTFYPYWKTPSTRMTGGNPAIGTFYDLPNVPWDTFFYQGYAIHGTYWHNNFGHPMSHGCINMLTADAKIIYDWVDFSTPIIIYGVAPSS